MFKINISSQRILKICVPEEYEQKHVNIVMHEFGHAFGLDDKPTGVLSIMQYSPSARALSAPNPVDIYGVKKYYGR